ncbi:hypothetical protein V1525DRAFT_412372 [Lipomyces kononenkoae]|uniref:Uncharacterized protein n=1 Tax=Lipomyces kononenkoae TaxID=34357 RepID=A0ACC3SSQ0_LIPKO
MDHIAVTAAARAPDNASYNLYVGMVVDSVENAREVVKAYAIQHNFAVKNGLVKNTLNPIYAHIFLTTV